ncbi:hypothetical protein BKA93DRAFT_761241 [Sparassis latifolia]
MTKLSNALRSAPYNYGYQDGRPQTLRQPSSQRPSPSGRPPYAQPPNGAPYFPAPLPTYVHGQSSGNSNAPSSSQTRVISAEDDMRRLLSACKTARGNAEMLHEALVYATPKDLKGELIKEFRAKCRTSQELILSEIPRASAEAERSRNAARVSALTAEELLLQELLGANEQIVDAFKIYDDLEHVGIVAEEQERLRFERVVQVVTAISAFTPTRDETVLIDQVFSLGDPPCNGTLDAHTAAQLLSGSNLTSSVLAKIWELANVEGSDQLSRQNVGAALRLVGHAQAGTPVMDTLLGKPGPTAWIEGLSQPVAQLQAVEGFPPVTPRDKAKFARIFASSNPVNGVLSSVQAGELFLKSKLPQETLRRIWDLADTRRRGVLGASDFAVGMYLIQATMSGQLATMPPTLPRVLYEQLGATPPNPIPEFPLLSFNTAPESPAHISTASPSSSQGWNITPAARAEADQIFNTLDVQNTGHVQGDAVVSFMFDSDLPMDVLERIWDLADTYKHGYLTRGEFAVAMHLISKQKAGKVLPSLPSSSSLVPPSMQASTSSAPLQNETEALLMDLNEAFLAPPPKPTSTSSRSSGSPRVSPNISSTSPASHSVHTPRSGPATPSSAAFHTPPASPPEASFSPTSAAFRTPPASPSLSYAAPSTSRPSSASGQRAEQPAGSAQHRGIGARERARSDRFFDTLDPWRRGWIDGDVAVPFFAKSKLPDSVMGDIWDMADMDHNGRLDRDEFAMAMHLIRGRLKGRDTPDSLPPLPPRPTPVVVTQAAPSPHHIPEPEPEPELAAAPPVSEIDFDEEEVRSDTPPPPYEEIPVADVG